ncbi:MAG: SdrD B-like domain-containing protein [Gallionellaceae bacterium]|nr:SdrD B-like domain-containing protein [Gallionellaceae bacterium]
MANSGTSQQSIGVLALNKPTISKSFSPSTLVLGGASGTLTITISNSNSVAIADFSLTDVFPVLANPANGGAVEGIIQVVNAGAATSSCTGAGIPATFTPANGATTISATGGTLAANGSCSLTVPVEAKHTNGLDTVTQANTINASTQFGNYIGIPAANNATANVTVRSPLRVAKAFTNGALASGQSDTLTVTLYNDSTTPLAITSFTDDPIDGVLPAGAGHPAYGLSVTGQSTSCGGAVAATTNNTGVTQTGGSIPAGGSCAITVTFTATVAAAQTPVTYTNTIPRGAVDVGNTAIVSQGPVSANIFVADYFHVTKSATPSVAAPGNPVRYSLTVYNYSNTVLNNVAVTDSLPNGMTVLQGVPYNAYYNCGGADIPVSATGSATTPVFTIASFPARSSVNTAGSCTLVFWGMTDKVAANGTLTDNTIQVNQVCDAGNVHCNQAPSNTTSGSISTAVLTGAKSFSPAGPLFEGAITRLTLALYNNSANALTNVALTDNLPTSGGQHLSIANPANAVSTCGSPTITATPGAYVLSMSGGSITARASNGLGSAGSCTLSVDVIGPAGVYTNTVLTTDVSATETYPDSTTHLINMAANATAGLTYNSALSAAKTFNPSAVSSGGSSRVTIRLSNGGATALTHVTVSDPLPVGMVVANPANAYSTCDGAPVITAVPGTGNNTGSVGMTGATIAGNASCDLLFDVAATGGANWVNTIPVGNITADGGVINQSAVVGTLVYQAPTNLTVGKTTNPNTLTFPGQVSVLTITVTNGSQTVNNLRLTDYFTVGGTVGGVANGMIIATTPGAATTCPGGVVAATPGGTSVSLSGANMSASTTCTITVNVTSTAVGGITNTIPAGAIITEQGLSNSGLASTGLATSSNIGVIKKFTPNVVKPGERSRLRLTFYNPTSMPMANLAVTDTLPAGVTVPSGANPVTDCLGGTLSSPATNQVQLTGGNIVAASGGTAASCYAEIDVYVAAQGDYVNTIPAGGVTATAGGAPATNSLPTSDTLRAKSALEVQKAIIGKTLDAAIQSGSGFSSGTATTTPGSAATLTIRLRNSNAVALTAAAFTDNLPTGLVVATTPNATTTCSGGTVLATASSTSIRLSGATIPGSGACTVTVDVLSNISGSYTNTIASGGVTTAEGVSNEEGTRAKLVVSVPPTVSKQFAPAVIPPNGTSTLTIVLGNSNASALTLASAFTDTLPIAPGQISVAAVPGVSTTCRNNADSAAATITNEADVALNAGHVAVRLPSGSKIPVGGCTITLNVTGATPGVHNNNIPAGALQTDFGNNQQPANSTLTISTLGYVSGRVFQDNNLTPNGIYEPGTDTPIAGVSIALHTGASCSNALVSQVGLTNPVTTDPLGNYLFSSLPAGTYSVCQSSQPAGTTNGTTTAGAITPVNSSTGTPGTASNPTSTSSQIIGIVLNGDGGGGEISGSSGNNFAEVAPSSISGTVFLDQNNNGIQNGADTGISSVRVDLLDGSGTLITFTNTDASGNYSFSNLLPGTYSVREPTQPPSTSNGITTAGAVGNGGTAGTASGLTTLPSVITSIILPPNTSVSGNNFAEIPNTRSIYGRVFVDYDNNGTLDSPRDHGIGAQPINLTGTDINGNPVSASTATASDGTYSFTGLPEGTYILAQPNQPTGTSNGITSCVSAGCTVTGVGTTPSVIGNIVLTGAATVSGENNFAETATATPDLAIAKTHSPDSFGTGGNTGYYTITPSNVGSAATSGLITVVDTLPAGITVAAPATGTGWSCVGAIGASSVSCTSSAVIAANATGNAITLRVAVASGLSGQILINTAVISGGSEPPGFDGNNTATDPTPITGTASLSGSVWVDVNHDRVKDVGEAVKSGWGVELLLGNVLVASTVSGSDGRYAITGIAPGSGYQLRFREPTTQAIFGYAVTNERGVTPVDNTRDTGATTVNTAAANPSNPAGADVSSRDGTLRGLKFLAGDDIVQQSLPLDPAGVIYDAITGLPVSGALVELRVGGVAVPSSCLVTSNPQTTGSDGFYQFLLLPGPPGGCPASGSTFTLAVTAPGSYLPAPSTFVPACAGTLTVGSSVTPWEVRDVDPGVGVNYLSATPHATVIGACPGSTAGLAPANQVSSQYYYDFIITFGGGGSANVVNNHIPLDPVLSGAIRMTKTTPLINVSKGDLVPYTITATNTLTGTLSNVDLPDLLPPGFKYKAGSASYDDDCNGPIAPVHLEPTVSGRTLTWPNRTFTAAGTAQSCKRIKLILVVGAGVGEGEYTNLVWAVNTIVNTRISNTAAATVRVVPDPTFDCSDIIGKVFDDQNANGYQDEGEPGIPNVRVATARGLLVTTDKDGRFHVACADIPQAQHGSNFIMKLDERSLPSGYRLTTENPREVRTTRGKMVKLNFGAAIHRVVRLELSDAAFQAGASDPAPALASALDKLPETLRVKPSVVRLAYQAGKEDGALASARLRAVRERLEELWKAQGCCYTLVFEEEIFERASAKKGGAK